MSGDNDHRGNRKRVRTLLLILLLFTGFAVGAGFYYLFLQRHLQYKSALEMAENGYYIQAIVQLEELGDYSDSEEQRYQIIYQLMDSYFETEQYFNLARLINMVDSSLADEIFRDLGIDVYHTGTFARAANQYGLELDHIGKLGMDDFSMKVLRWEPPGFSDQELIQPRIFVTDYDVWISTIYGYVHVNTIYDMNGEIGLELPRDSLATRISEVHDHFAVAFPDLEVSKACIVTTETVPYGVIADIAGILENAGYSGMDIQVAPGTGHSQINFAGRAQNTNTESAANDEDILAVSVSEDEDEDSSALNMFATIEAIHAAGIEYGVNYRISTSVDTIESSSRTIDGIRYQLDILRGSLESAYEEHHLCHPNEFGGLLMRFYISPSGEIVNELITSRLGMTLFQDQARAALGSIHFDSVSEQTEELMLEVLFTFLPSDD